MAKQEKSAAEIYREERKARLAKAAKKNSKGKAISSKAGSIAGKVIAVVVAVAVVVGIAAFAVNQSGVIQRGKTALKIGDITVSQPEYTYYYLTVFKQYANYVQYGYQFGLDLSKNLEDQEYEGTLGEIEDFPEDKTPTWADFFEYATIRNIKYAKASAIAAKELGLELGEEEMAEVQETIDAYKQQAESMSESSDSGMRYSYSSYLKLNFGKGMSAKLFKSILEEQEYSRILQETKLEEMKEAVTDKEIKTEYKDNIISYGVIDYLSYAFAAEKVVSTDDESETEAVTDETMAAAKKEAEAFAAAVKDQASFKALASQAAKESGADDYEQFLEDDTLTLTENMSYEDLSSVVYDDEFYDWAFSEKTAENSTYIVENSSTGYTVYMMVNPVHKAPDKLVYTSRHILINFTEDEETEESTSTDETASEEADETADTETTAEQTTVAEKEEVKVETLDVSKYTDVTVDLDVDADTATDKEAYKKAQDILEEYLNGERTAEAFGALATEYTEDSGSKDTGGLYEDTEIGNFVEPYETWCLKEGRKAGDVGIVESISTNYSGYHIIYFVGDRTVTWKENVITAVANAKYDDYANELVKADNVAAGEISQDVSASVLASANSLASQYSSSSSSYYDY